MAADLRGALGFQASSASTTNAILQDGTIQGLTLNLAHPTLVVRNYVPANSRSPIYIQKGMSMDGNGTLQFQISGTGGASWGSTISFPTAVPVTLAGTVELSLAPGTNPAGLLGNSVPLFDWTNVSPNGQFDQIVSDVLPTRYSWDTSALDSLGNVQLTTSGTAINGLWAQNGSAAWSGSANWTDGNVPGAPQDAAVFGSILSSGTATVTLDYGVSLASLGLGTTGGASYLISSANGSTMILASTAGAATLSNSGGNHTIAAPIILGSGLSVSASAGSVLNLVNAISQSGGSDSLSLDGGGELILGGSNSYRGGTTVLSGTLELTSAAAMPGSGVWTVAAAGSVVMENTSEIKALARGPVSAVPEPAALTLLGVGAVVLAVLGWRRRVLRRRGI